MGLVVPYMVPIRPKQFIKRYMFGQSATSSCYICDDVTDELKNRKVMGQQKIE